MKIEDIKLTNYKLKHKIEFYNHRAGMFAYFDAGLVVGVYRKNTSFATQTVMVSFPGGRIEVYPDTLEEI